MDRMIEIVLVNKLLDEEHEYVTWFDKLENGDISKIAVDVNYKHNEVYYVESYIYNFFLIQHKDLHPFVYQYLKFKYPGMSVSDVPF